MDEDSLTILCIAAVFAIPFSIWAVGAPSRKKRRARDRAEGRRRADLCQRRGWTFRRDDRRAPDSKFIIWRIMGGCEGMPWQIGFGESWRDDVRRENCLEFVCSAAATPAPVCAFSTEGQLNSSQDGCGQVALAINKMVALGTGGSAQEQRFFRNAALCTCEQPPGYAWAATTPALALRLARDDELSRTLAAVVRACPPEKGALPLWVTFDSTGLTARAYSDFVTADTLESLADAMCRVLAVTGRGH